jgi:hypothetical protein
VFGEAFEQFCVERPESEVSSGEDWSRTGLESHVCLEFGEVVIGGFGLGRLLAAAFFYAWGVELAFARLILRKNFVEGWVFYCVWLCLAVLVHGSVYLGLG